MSVVISTQESYTYEPGVSAAVLAACMLLHACGKLLRHCLNT